MKNRHVLLAFSLAVLSFSSTQAGFAYEDRNNIQHWHGGGGRDTEIYVEEYPDGTVYVNQDNSRYVSLGKRATVNCQQDMAG